MACTAGDRVQMVAAPVKHQSFLVVLRLLMLAVTSTGVKYVQQLVLLATALLLL